MNATALWGAFAAGGLVIILIGALTNVVIIGLGALITGWSLGRLSAMLATCNGSHRRES